MNCEVCDCNSGMSNTGVGCSTIMRDVYGLVLVPIYANDGTRNGITLSSATLDQTYFDALVNQTDVSKRWFPVATEDGLKDAEQVRENPVFKTFTDGSKEFIRQGSKPFKGYITGRNATPTYEGKLNAARCLAMGVYKIDRGGNLIGSISSDGLILYPIAIDSQSFNAVYGEATPDKNNAMIELTFDFSLTELDQSLKMISCNEFDNYSAFQLRGLIDVCPVFSNITTSGVRVKLKTEYGTPLNPTTDKGLVAADFAFYNETASSAIGIVGTGGSFVEDPTAPGNYDIEFDTADQPSIGDEITLTVTKNGRDYSCVSDDPFTVANT